MCAMPVRWDGRISLYLPASGEVTARDGNDRNVFHNELVCAGEVLDRPSFVRLGQASRAGKPVSGLTSLDPPRDSARRL